MKVLILSCNTGQGHNAAGQALYEEFQARGVECAFLDALSLSNDAVSNAISGAYVATVQKAPHLFGGLYKVGDKISSDRHKSPIYLMNIAQTGALKEYIALHGITTVVTPHLFPAEMLTHLRRRHALEAKCFSVATDYTCIPFWEETEMDGYIVPHEDLLYEYVERGLPVELLLPLGIPASERFSQPMRTQEARDLLGLPQDQPIFLVMTGSMGYGGAARIARDLAAQMESALVLVLAGATRNSKARSIPCAIPASAPSPSPIRCQPTCARRMWCSPSPADFPARKPPCATCRSCSPTPFRLRNQKRGLLRIPRHGAPGQERKRRGLRHFPGQGRRGHRGHARRAAKDHPRPCRAR